MVKYFSESKGLLLRYRIASICVVIPKEEPSITSSEGETGDGSTVGALFQCGSYQ